MEIFLNNHLHWLAPTPVPVPIPVLAPPPLPPPQPNILNFIFASGPWYNRYFQHGMWHGPFQHSMTFNPYNNTITGSGVDNVGAFMVYGYYSMNTLQIMIGQAYVVRDFLMVLLINTFDVVFSTM